MFKEGKRYKVCDWNELVRRACNVHYEGKDASVLSFENTDWQFGKGMAYLCGRTFIADKTTYSCVLDNYTVTPEMCEEVSNYYKVGNIETIDVIESMGWGTGFNLGNAIKYIMRCEHKENKEADLKKAIWYLNRELGGDK